MGIVVPRFGHSAVDRNRLKRRLREITRVELLPGLASVDLLVRTRAEAYGATFEALRSQLLRVRARLTPASQ